MVAVRFNDALRAVARVLNLKHSPTWNENGSGDRFTGKRERNVAAGPTFYSSYARHSSGLQQLASVKHCLVFLIAGEIQNQTQRSCCKGSSQSRAG